MGVVVPALRTVEDFTYAVKMLKYPPEGLRPLQSILKYPFSL
jgi:2-keto-3-deoxy-L-rhamnonate aldolase RhmA